MRSGMGHISLITLITLSIFLRYGTPLIYPHALLLRTMTIEAEKGRGNGAGVLPTGVNKQLQYHGIDKDKADQIVEAAERSVVEWTSTTTSFLTPSELNAIELSFKDVVDVKFCSFGGYSQAERQVGAFSRQEEYEVELDHSSSGGEELLPCDDIDEIIALIHVEGNFLLDKAKDTDFRDSILALPFVEPAMVGDILVLGERGCQVLTTSRAAADVLELKQVRTVPVTVRRVELGDLKVRPKSVKELSCVESSTRLDAIGSAGLGVSRAKMVKAIESGQVTVNYKEAKRSNIELKTGDVVLAKNIGRLDVLEIGETRKGKVRANVRKTS